MTREPPRVGMVVGQARHVMIECVDTCSREEAGLPHRAAKHLAESPCARDERRTSNKGASDRCAETL